MKQILFSVVLLVIGHFAEAQRYELNRKDTSESEMFIGKRHYVYKVEKGETIFSITRRFGVTEDELRKSNPELKDGLKNKMRLLIPAASVVTTEPEKKAETKKVNRVVEVAILAPFNLWKNFIPDSVLTDTSDNNDMDKESLAQLEFYEGALRAVESLAGKNNKIHLRIYDTYNDTVQAGILLNSPRMKEMNYLVVNGSAAIIRKVSRFSYTNRIPLLSFALNATESLKDNPYGYALTPSSVTQCYEAGKFCSEKFRNANAVVVKSGTGKETDRAIAFINGWNDNSAQKARSIDYSKGEFTFLLANLVKGTMNVLFLPTSNEDFVNTVVTRLHDTTDVYPITVIGIPTWQYFESNDPTVMENLNTHLFSSSDMNSDGADETAFRKFFRAEYFTEPSESAFQGHDALVLIANSISGGANDSLKVTDGLFSKYRFQVKEGTNENQFIRMLRYTNFELLEVK